LFFSCDTYDHFLLVLGKWPLYNSDNFDDFFMISL
jgi:hypothetical protein